MMALGDFRFHMDGAAYQSLERESAWRWPTTERVGSAPMPQFVGPGDDTIRLSGVIYPHYRGGLGQIDAMRAEANKGVPLPLVDGMGRNWGRWVITSIHEGQTVFFSNGAPRSQSFEVGLTKYDDGHPSAV